MRARRGLAIACALGLLAGVAAVGPAAARTVPWHFTAVGPGVQAAWVNEDGVTTSLFVFHQLNAPGSQGYFEDVIVALSGGSGAGAWSAMYDSWEAPQQPTIAIQQPLVSASVVATVLFVGCLEGPCPVLPEQVDVDEGWTGVGPIDRISDAFVINDPAATLFVGHGRNFFRGAELADADPFDDGLGTLGTLQSARFFDVHIANILICHPGAVCE
ncbi:MAG: hypothetical protein A2V85_14360 [Chloroflexi bacterium RBG_16_72_14]|nr:MAG: hypothetical protein A2V85_14360 [Chloroflexi bacterium RBG_16_72_14]